MIIEFVKRTKALLLLGLITLVVVILTIFFSNINRLNGEIDEAHRVASYRSTSSDEYRHYEYVKDMNSAKIKTEYMRLYSGVATLVVLSGFVIYVSNEKKPEKN